MQITCCNGCVPPKRQLYCHSNCPEYILQKEARDNEIELKLKQSLVENYNHDTRKRLSELPRHKAVKNHGALHRDSSIVELSSNMLDLEISMGD